MNLKEYQNAARNTAIYLKVENSKMIYPALGLVGECGEVAEKIKKMIRDDDNEITPERREAIRKELGDVMWYVANICCDIDWDMKSIYIDPGSLARNIQHLVFPRLILEMVRSTSLVASQLEKWYYGKYTANAIKLSNKSLDTRQHLGNILNCVNEIAFRCGFTLEEIYTSNIEKLLSRKARGKLGGSGDDR
jgi:hypothetical protein